MWHERYLSPMGPLCLWGDREGLQGLSFQPPKDPAPDPDGSGQFELIKHWLDAYFAGQPEPVNFPLCPRGTEFQRQVWKLLLEIPYGEIRTYGQIAGDAAKLLGKERMSAQAAGQAVSRNPIAIIIPCHRVIGAGNALTGYAGGLERKVWLLRHEGWQPDR